MSNSISKALMALYENINNSMLADNERNVLKILIEKLIVYYTNEYKKQEECRDCFDYTYRMEKLSSQMTDYIVTINDTIKGSNDVHCIVNKIYQEINYDEKKGIFKRKRLI